MKINYNVINLIIAAILVWIGLFAHMAGPFAVILIVKSFAILGVLLILDYDFAKK